MSATELRDLATMEFLIKAGADIHKQDSWGKTALSHAVTAYPYPEESYLTAIKILIDAGANANVRDYRGRTPLLSCLMDHERERRSSPATVAKVCQMLIAAGAETNIKHPQSGYTPLVYAAKNGYLPIVQALITAGANKTVKIWDKWTAFDYATTEEIKALLRGN
jgi:ankyrin repeat protein